MSVPGTDPPLGGIGGTHWTRSSCDFPPAPTAANEPYRATQRAKLDEVSACIEVYAEQTDLVDQPFRRRSLVRVVQPFPLDAVQPPGVGLDGAEPFGQEQEALTRPVPRGRRPFVTTTRGSSTFRLFGQGRPIIPPSRSILTCWRRLRANRDCTATKAGNAKARFAILGARFS